jgi:hypothetical protein
MTVSTLLSGLAVVSVAFEAPVAAALFRRGGTILVDPVPRDFKWLA